MQYKIDETNFNVTMTAANFDVVVTASAPLEVAVGESARLDVGEAVNYIESGKAELQPLVDEAKGYKNDAQTAAISADRSAQNAENSAQRAESAAASFVPDKTYVFDQGVASDTWTITHNLGKKPSVTVVDSADNVFYPAVQYIDLNTLVVTMNGATTGKAYLN